MKFIKILFILPLYLSLAIAHPSLGKETGAPKQTIGTLLEYKKSMQSHFETRLSDVLSKILGTNNVEVRVNVEVSTTDKEETITDFDPEKSVIISERAGKAADEETVQYENKKILQKISTPIGSIKNISTAIIINEKYSKNLSGSDKEAALKKIEDIVQKTIGYNFERGDSIAIHFSHLAPINYNFVEPSSEERSVLYFGYIAAAILAFILLFFAMHYYHNWQFRTQHPEEPANTAMHSLSEVESMDLTDKLRYFAKNDPERTIQALRKYMRS